MKGVDTTFLIDLLRNDKGAVLKSLELEREPMVFTTEANVYEVVSGVQQMKANRDVSMGNAQTLFRRLTVLPLDRKAAIKAGEIAGELSMAGKMIDDIDCLAAGILMTNGCDTVVTRNARHFGRIKGLKVEIY